MQPSGELKKDNNSSAKKTICKRKRRSRKNKKVNTKSSTVPLNTRLLHNAQLLVQSYIVQPFKWSYGDKVTGNLKDISIDAANISRSNIFYVIYREYMKTLSIKLCPIYKFKNYDLELIKQITSEKLDSYCNDNILVNFSINLKYHIVFSKYISEILNNIEKMVKKIYTPAKYVLSTLETPKYLFNEKDYLSIVQNAYKQYVTSHIITLQIHSILNELPKEMISNITDYNNHNIFMIIYGDIIQNAFLDISHE